jgi:ferredoxin
MPFHLIVPFFVIFIISALAFWTNAKYRWLSLPVSRRTISSKGMFQWPYAKKIADFLYARWPDFFLGVFFRWISPVIDEGMKLWIRDHYHGKVLTQELAEAVFTINQSIPLQDLEQIIPYAAARELVLTMPLEIATTECACRRSRPSHCEPTQVCLIIGQPFVDYAIKDNPGRGRRITPTEALEILRAEHARGHVHSAYFKENHLDRFYVICNCCKCCCGGIEAMVKYNNPVIAPSGFIATLDDALCISCGACAEACPFGALSMQKTAVLAWEKCMGCGVCETTCPQAAISLVREPRKGIPLDVRLLQHPERGVPQPLPGERQSLPNAASALGQSQVKPKLQHFEQE